MARWFGLCVAIAVGTACSSAPDSVETVASSDPTSTSTTASPSTTAPASATAPTSIVDPDEPRWLTVDPISFELVSDTGEVFAGLGTPETGGILRRAPDGTIDFVPAIEVDGSQYRTRVEASNGLAVEAVAADTSPDGYDVFEPGAIELFDSDGRSMNVWPLGSTASPFVDVIDFNGRLILAGRYPVEPVMAEVEYFVIDIECASCVETFWGQPMLASLYGPDAEAEPDAFDVDSFGPCPSWRELPVDAPSGLEPEIEAAFVQLAQAVARCDARYLRFDVPDFADPEPDDWTMLASLLETAPEFVDGTAVWSAVGPGGATATMRPYDPVVRFGHLEIELSG